jgi:hypothetical protein
VNLQRFLAKVQELARAHLLDLAERQRLEEQQKIRKAIPVPPARVLPAPKPPVERVQPRAQAYKPPPSKAPTQALKKLPEPEKPAHFRRIAAPFQGSVFKSSTPKPASQKGAEIDVAYFDEGVGRLVMNRVSRRRYVELWDKGLLKFQHQKTEKPEHLPSREEVAESL